MFTDTESRNDDRLKASWFCKNNLIWGLDARHQANPELYQPDAVHLNAAGYEKLTAGVKPAIASLLNQSLAP